MSLKAAWARLWVLGQPRLVVRPFSQETVALREEQLGGRTQVEVQCVLDSFWLFNLVMDPRIPICNTLRLSEFPRLTKIGAQRVTYCVAFSIAVPCIQTYWVMLLGMKYTNAGIGQLWQYIKPWVRFSAILLFILRWEGVGLTNAALSGLELSQIHRNSPAFASLVLGLQVVCFWAFE